MICCLSGREHALADKAFAVTTDHDKDFTVSVCVCREEVSERLSIASERLPFPAIVCKLEFFERCVAQIANAVNGFCFVGRHKD
jgi:hypothetical protein